MEPSFEAKGQRLDVRLDPALPPGLADRDRLVQIVTNLLSNAYKYTQCSGADLPADLERYAAQTIAGRDPTIVLGWLQRGAGEAGRV